MEYFVTYYIQNTSDAKEIFNIIPFKYAVVTGNEDYVLEVIAAKLKDCPYFRCCSIMVHSDDPQVMELKYMIANPHYKEDALQKAFKIQENVERKEIDDSGKNVMDEDVLLN